jgi:hypothetical protein
MGVLYEALGRKEEAVDTLTRAVTLERRLGHADADALAAGAFGRGLEQGSHGGDRDAQLQFAQARGRQPELAQHGARIHTEVACDLIVVAQAGAADEDGHGLLRARVADYSAH